MQLVLPALLVRRVRWALKVQPARQARQALRAPLVLSVPRVKWVHKAQPG